MNMELNLRFSGYHRRLYHSKKYPCPDLGDVAGLSVRASEWIHQLETDSRE